MKSTLEGLSSRLNEEEWITELEDRVVEIIMAEQKKEKKVKRNEDSLRDIWGIKHISIPHYRGGLRRRRERGRI